MASRLGTRAASPGDHRDRPGQAREVPRRAHHDGPRRRRARDPQPGRGPARARASGSRRSTTRRSSASSPSPPTRTSSSRCASRAARSASWRSTAPSTTSRWRARSRSRSRSRLILEEGLDAATLRAEVEAIAPRGGSARACGSSAATRRSSSAATPTGCTSRRPGSGARDPRAAFEPARPGDRILLSGPIAAHGTAIMLARGEFDLESDEIVSDTRSLWPAVDAILGPGIRAAARRHPRRRGERPERARARRGRRDADRGGRRSRSRPRSPAPASCSASTRCTSPTRASSSCSPTGRCDGFTDIGEVKTEPPGMVLVKTAFGGKRVMDELVGDPLPRIC